MTPLLLLLALGGLGAYALSPRAHTWVDEHVTALQSLFAAVRAANAHVDAAHAAPDPVAAAMQTQAAEAARAQAAQQATIAAKTAKTPAQRSLVDQGIAAVRQLGANIAALGSAALDKARAAHLLADTHAVASQNAPNPEIAAGHAQIAEAAHRDAAGNTAVAAAAAQTSDQRQAAVESAAHVEDREKNFGVGQCTLHTYARVTAQVKDALLTKLHAEGMTVTGVNPWFIDTHKSKVWLRAAWDPTTQVLKLIVTAGASDAGPLGDAWPKIVCPEVWKKIDPIMKELTG